MSTHKSFSTFFGGYLGTTFFWILGIKSTPKIVFKTISIR